MIDVENQHDIAVMTVAHGKVNALDLELLLELTAAFRTRAEDPRPLVVTGVGSTFCAGVDLRRIVAGGTDYVEAFLPALSDAFLAVFEHPAPVVAALNGHALAGGCVVAAACDARVAVRGRGTVGVTELLVGVPYPTAAVEILRHAVGDPAAALAVYRGRRYSMAEAQGMGLVTDLVEENDALLPTATQLASALGRLKRPAFTLAKTQLRRGAVERISAHRGVDDALLTQTWAAPDTMASIRSYLDGLKVAR
jgi:enoyl-CoA hydratase